MYFYRNDFTVFASYRLPFSQITPSPTHIRTHSPIYNAVRISILRAPASRPPPSPASPCPASLLPHFTPRFADELQTVDVVSVVCMLNRFSDDGFSKNCTKNRNVLPRDVFVSVAVPRKPIVSYLSLPPNRILFVSFSYQPTFLVYTPSTRLHAAFRFHSDMFPPSFSWSYCRCYI